MKKRSKKQKKDWSGVMIRKMTERPGRAQNKGKKQKKCLNCGDRFFEGCGDYCGPYCKGQAEDKK